MNLFPKRKTLSISLWVRLEFTMFKKLKWQGLSKKTRSQIYPIKFNLKYQDVLGNEFKVENPEIEIEIL